MLNAQTMPISAITAYKAICPACRRWGAFEFAGIQTWPARVAERLGFTETRLWNCEHCHSTISESELK